MEMLEAKIEVLKDENARLRNALLRAQTTIERQAARLRTAGLVPLHREHHQQQGGGDQDGESASSSSSCVTMEATVRNTLGEKLFRVFMDPPESATELLSWFEPFTSGLSLPKSTRVKYVTSSQWIPVEVAPLSSLDDVTAVIVGDDEADDDGGLLPSSSSPTEGKGPFCVSQVLLTVASYLPPSGVARLSQVCRYVYHSLWTEHARQVAHDRFVCNNSSATISGPLLAAGFVFVLRPVISGFAVHAQDRTRPLRAMDGELHCLSPSSGSILPPRLALDSVLAFESFCRTTLATLQPKWSPALQKQTVDGKPLLRCSSIRSTPDTFDFSEFAVLGLQLDVLDTVNKWYDATIVDFDDGTGSRSSDSQQQQQQQQQQQPAAGDGQIRVKVHYNKWSNNWDEWIDLPQRLLRFQPLGSKFDTRVNTLRSTIAFFQLVDHVEKGSGGSKVVLYTDDIGMTDVAEHLDGGGRWEYLVRSVFKDINQELLSYLRGAKLICRPTGKHDILAMIETSLVHREALIAFLDEKPVACRRRRNDDDEEDDDEDAVVIGGTSLCILRLVELYTEETVNGFFVAVNHRGEGLVYARYGARHWKH